MPSISRQADPTSHPSGSALLVKYRMSESLHSIGKDQPVAVAHRLMREHHLRHLPVLEQGKLVGLVSERDLDALEAATGVNPDTKRVEESMTQDVYCVSPEAKLCGVMVEMARHKHECAVVVESGKAIAVFTTTDALKLLAEGLDGE